MEVPPLLACSWSSGGHLALPVAPVPCLVGALALLWLLLMLGRWPAWGGRKEDP